MAKSTCPEILKKIRKAVLELLPFFRKILLKKILQKSSSLKLLGQLEPNLVTKVVGWSHLKIVSDMSARNPRWPPAGNMFNIGPYGEIQRSSLLDLLYQLEPNLVTMVLGWSPLKTISNMSASDPRWPPTGNIV